MRVRVPLRRTLVAGGLSVLVAVAALSGRDALLSRRRVPLVVQPARIEELRVRETHRAGFTVHEVHELSRAARQPFGQGNRGVVRRLQHERVQQLLDGDSLPQSQAELGEARAGLPLLCGGGSDGHDATGAGPGQSHQGGHDLGGAGERTDRVRAPGEQDFPRSQVLEDGGPSPDRRRRSRHLARGRWGMKGGGEG